MQQYCEKLARELHEWLKTDGNLVSRFFEIRKISECDTAMLTIVDMHIKICQQEKVDGKARMFELKLEGYFADHGYVYPDECQHNLTAACDVEGVI